MSSCATELGGVGVGDQSILATDARGVSSLGPPTSPCLEGEPLHALPIQKMEGMEGGCASQH